MNDGNRLITRGIRIWAAKDEPAGGCAVVIFFSQPERNPTTCVGRGGGRAVGLGEGGLIAGGEESRLRGSC